MSESNAPFVQVSSVSVPSLAGVYWYQTDLAPLPASPAWFGSPLSTVASTVVPFTEAVFPLMVWALAKALWAGPCCTRFHARVKGPPEALLAKVTTAMRYVVPEVAAKDTRAGTVAEGQPPSSSLAAMGVDPAV